MTGSYAANAHEGSRSEYLAQYVFAALGTVVPVPHQEDHGIDLYCTLTERIGRRAWPLAYYTVQVKSNDQPWTFEGPRSVEWLLEQPLPLFVCTVDKKQARLRVFRTDVRFASNFLRPLPRQVRLHLRAPMSFVQTGEVFDLSLGDPILDATINDLLEEGALQRWGEILLGWVEVAEESILRWRQGVRAIISPMYQTNELPDWSRQGATEATLAPEAIPSLAQFLQHVARSYELADDRDDPNAVLIETLVCVLHWQLMRTEGADMLMGSHLRLSAWLDEAGPFGGATSLIETIRERLRLPSQPALPTSDPS